MHRRYLRAAPLPSVKNLIAAGGIKEYHYLAIDRQPAFYDAIYTVVIGEQTRTITLEVSDGGVVALGGDSVPPSTPYDALSFWSELLWEYYEGCHFDPELGEYVYDSDGG